MLAFLVVQLYKCLMFWQIIDRGICWIKRKALAEQRGLAICGNICYNQRWTSSSYYIRFHFARDKYILLDKGIIIASHPVVNMEGENSMDFGG